MEQAREIGELILEVGREAATPLRGAADETGEPASNPGGQPRGAKPGRKG